MSVMAVGLDEELFILDHIVLYGDPSTTTLWLKLDEELKRTYKREDGKLMTITSACVDSGYYTNQVYSFCKSKVARRIYAIKGISGNKPLFPRRASINNVMKCPLFTIGVDSAKDILLSRLKIEKHGSGYVHFPKHLDTEYFLQLQSERIKTKFLKGIATREWVQVRKRNEAWDCLVYAYASFISLNANLEKIKESLDKAPKQQKNKPTFKKNFITDWRD
jgi:phage terminase large subunit GpA-like protein